MTKGGQGVEFQEDYEKKTTRNKDYKRLGGLGRKNLALAYLSLVRVDVVLRTPLQPIPKQESSIERGLYVIGVALRQQNSKYA